MLFDFEPLYADLEANDYSQWREILPQQLQSTFQQRQHGKMAEWQSILSYLPELQASLIQLKSPRITIGQALDIDPTQRERLIDLLKQLHPWRKGPYELFGIHIDTEWRSDLKWGRILPHLSSIRNRRVLDVGCGNGYHLWRILGEGARLAIGVDPSQFFLVQFSFIKNYVSSSVQKGLESLPAHILPFKSEELPAFATQFKGNGFDTVFSMGVLYHRVSPIEHLQELKSFLRPGGELVLETLIIESANSEVLIPKDRYAKMRNVWFLPSPDLLVRMLERVGFSNIRVVDINQTSIEEQRSTQWMQYESLPDFLDTNDSNQTVEGYPAPKRAVFICNN